MQPFVTQADHPSGPLHIRDIPTSPPWSPSDAPAREAKAAHPLIHLLQILHIQIRPFNLHRRCCSGFGLPFSGLGNPARLPRRRGQLYPPCGSDSPIPVRRQGAVPTLSLRGRRHDQAVGGKGPGREEDQDQGEQNGQSEPTDAKLCIPRSGDQVSGAEGEQVLWVWS